MSMHEATFGGSCVCKYCGGYRGDPKAVKKHEDEDCEYKPVAPMDMPDEIRAFLLNEKMAKRDRRRGKQADDGSSSSQPPRDDTRSADEVYADLMCEFAQIDADKEAAKKQEANLMKKNKQKLEQATRELKVEIKPDGGEGNDGDHQHQPTNEVKMPVAAQLDPVAEKTRMEEKEAKKKEVNRKKKDKKKLKRLEAEAKPMVQTDAMYAGDGSFSEHKRREDREIVFTAGEMGEVKVKLEEEDDEEVIVYKGTEFAGAKADIQKGYWDRKFESELEGEVIVYKVPSLLACGKSLVGGDLEEVEDRDEEVFLYNGPGLLGSQTRELDSAVGGKNEVNSEEGEGLGGKTRQVADRKKDAAEGECEVDSEKEEEQN